MSYIKIGGAILSEFLLPLIAVPTTDDPKSGVPKIHHLASLVGEVRWAAVLGGRPTGFSPPASKIGGDESDARRYPGF